MIIKDHSMYPTFGGPIGCPVSVTVNIIKKKGGVSTLDKIRQVGLNIQDHWMVNEDKTKVEGAVKPKGRRFQQSISPRKANLKSANYQT